MTMAVSAVALLCLLATVVATPAAADTAVGPPIGSAGIPVRLQIPSIAVDAAIEDVGLTDASVMGLPTDDEDAAWYALGPRPGERGNAVIDGHVDSTVGIALFWELHTLAPGDTIAVVGDDGVAHRFAVAATVHYAAADVPLARIFGAADGAHLNLITCDADTPFDHSTGSYAGYVVVYADAVA